MTKKDKRNRRYKKESIYSLLQSLSIIAASVFVAFLLSPYISVHVRSGLILCAESIIGSVFPFMILSDAIMGLVKTEELGVLRKGFEKLFKINGSGVKVFLVGILCGFPVGAKSARTLYESGDITKEECERLISFTNNASPAFIISGIGYLMRGSIRDGVILYLSTMLSSIAVGMLLGIKKSPSKLSNNLHSESFNFVISVKNASLSTLNICGFVTFFSVVCGIIKDFFHKKSMLIFSAIFLEIGNAASTLSSGLLPSNISLILTSFAISFSGISVYMQVRSFFNNTDIALHKYFYAKLLEGVFSSIITLSIISI